MGNLAAAVIPVCVAACVIASIIALLIESCVEKRSKTEADKAAAAAGLEQRYDEAAKEVLWKKPQADAVKTETTT